MIEYLNEQVLLSKVPGGVEVECTGNGGWWAQSVKDKVGNEIHYRDSKGRENWTVYNSTRQSVYYKDNKGFECWNAYDRKGNNIGYKDNSGLKLGVYRTPEETLVADEAFHELEPLNTKVNALYLKLGILISMLGDEEMIEPETSEQLLDGIPGGRTVTLSRKGTKGWLQTIRDGQGQVLYSKDVSISFFKEEIFEEWWEYNDSGQVTYNRDSNGLECWYTYDSDGKDCGFKDNRGRASGIYEQNTGAEERKAVEQRLEDIENSLVHLSQQMKLIMSAEYTLGDYE